jgi:hypothetical protein
MSDLEQGQTTSFVGKGYLMLFEHAFSVVISEPTEFD